MCKFTQKCYTYPVLFGGFATESILVFFLLFAFSPHKAIEIAHFDDANVNFSEISCFPSFGTGGATLVILEEAHRHLTNTISYR